jgi:uncharacterized repeat protein (TIGR04052 family)
MAVVLIAAGVLRYRMAERSLVIMFDARVGALPFACGVSFDGIGTTRTAVSFEDFRLYVHDVRVVTEAGEVDVALEEDGVWQNDGLALLDFEGPGCAGNAVTNTRIVGKIPARTPAITGVRFVLGVPARLDHLEVATAPSPRNLSAMYWGWEAGYTYLRIEGRSRGEPAGFRYHLGATGCAVGASARDVSCAEVHLAPVALDHYDEQKSAIVVDLAALFSRANLDGDASLRRATDAGEPRGGRGCMGESAEPECAPFFAALGLAPSSTQRLFRVREASAP